MPKAKGAAAKSSRKKASKAKVKDLAPKLASTRMVSGGLMRRRYIT